MKVIRWIVCATIFLGCAAGYGQIRVTKAAESKTTLDMNGFNAPSGTAAEFKKILENDLVRSGWFRPVHSGVGAFRMLGSATDRGRSIKVECRIYRSGNQQALFSKSYRGKQDEVRALAHRAADEIVEALTGRPGIASSRIVMVGTQSGSKELYYCDADGHNLVQWTRDKSVSVAPKWGPEGRKVVYTSYLRRFPDVFSIDLSSGKREQIAGYGGLNTGADISPDGRDVVLILSKDGNPELYVKNLKSGRLTRLTKTPHAVEASPSWSPDGEQIVYVSDQSGRPQLYLLSRKGGRPVRLTTRGLENVSPDWGSSGLIVFSSRVGGRYQVCTVDPRTREVTQITEGRADFEDPSWAPDGRHIAATRTENYRSEVYILDTMGDPPIALTSYKGDWYSPAWSPR